jgi:hypothetical protein
MIEYPNLVEIGVHWNQAAATATMQKTHTSHVLTSWLTTMKRLPPLPALHTFLVTAQHCNFTRAAQQLHITQGAVSRQIAGLEEHLGYALFQRQAVA